MKNPKANIFSYVPLLAILAIITISVGATSNTYGIADLTTAKFSKTTTIQDIIAIHDSGVTVDQYIAQVAANAQSPRATAGQISSWDSLKSYATNPSPSCINEPSNIGACNIMLSFAYETYKGVSSLTECATNKNTIEAYIAANNLKDKTNEYAYEFLEIMSAINNPSPTNTVDEMIYFSGNSDRSAVAYLEGYMGVRG